MTHSPTYSTIYWHSQKTEPPPKQTALLLQARISTDTYILPGFYDDEGVLCILQPNNTIGSHILILRWAHMPASPTTSITD